MPPSGRRLTLLYRLYRTAASLLVPVAYWSVSRKLRAQGVPVSRVHERLGNATLPRPAAPIVWFHAASVGESLSVLTLITRMGERLPETDFLITSGTATSAQLIAHRLPPRTVHQFAPLDATGPVDRFYGHWRPRAGIFVESEIWPNLLLLGQAAGLRLALLNARLSEKSVQGWRKWPDSARLVLGAFDVMLTQNRKTADNLIAMGADPEKVQTGANLKSTSAPLPVDADLLDRSRADLKDRPVWVASSTHPGEEEIVLAAHRRLLATHPDLCLLLVPRHPERGDAIAALVADAGLSCARRTAQQPITAQTQVYLADTLGETGTWYALSQIVFLGGSLLPIGGHNPFEPAQAGAAVITGPHVANFAETYTPLIATGGAVEAGDAAALAGAVRTWLEQPDALTHARDAARGFVEGQQAVLDSVVDTLCTKLELMPADA